MTDGTMHYFTRSLSVQGSDDCQVIIYAVRETPPDRRTDPVRVVGAFPSGWRPTTNPGEALRDQSCPDELWLCEVPRNQFRHYTEIPAQEAFARYPALEESAARPPARPTTR